MVTIYHSNLNLNIVSVKHVLEVPWMSKDQNFAILCAPFPNNMGGTRMSQWQQRVDATPMQQEINIQELFAPDSHYGSRVALSDGFSLSQASLAFSWLAGEIHQPTVGKKDV